MNILDTIAALHRALDERPDDHLTRLVLADALEEAGGELALLAPGYRALGKLRKCPGPGHVKGVPKDDAERFWEEGKSEYNMEFRALPRAWFACLGKAHTNAAYPSRREAEDAAALAFAALPPDRRAELLAAG